MKQWYLFFSTTEANEKLPQLMAELQKIESPYLIRVRLEYCRLSFFYKISQ